jgi:hypothetical protein
VWPSKKPSSVPSPSKDGYEYVVTFSGVFRGFPAGTHLEVMGGGSRRINGVRNFRQALASPHPAVRFTDSAWPTFVEVPTSRRVATGDTSNDAEQQIAEA